MTKLRSRDRRSLDELPLPLLRSRPMPKRLSPIPPWTALYCQLFANGKPKICDFYKKSQI